MDTSTLADTSQMIRNVRSYRIATQVGADDYYYEDIADPTMVDYQDIYTGVCFVYVPAVVSQYRLHAMAESTSVDAPILGVEIEATTTASFKVNIVRGRVTGGGSIIDSRYTDGRTFTTGAYYKIGWWYTTNNTLGPSYFWVNNISAEISGVPTTSNPAIFTRQIVYGFTTPINYELCNMLVSVDSTLTLTSSTFLQSKSLSGDRAPIYLGTGKYTSSGKIKCLSIDNGTSTLKNLATGNALLHRQTAIAQPYEYKVNAFVQTA